MPTNIEWAEETWNPITGCTPVSEGCANCYAERMARRLAGRFGYPLAPDHFRVTVHEDKLDQPLRWRKPRRIFVCSMGDLFHEDVAEASIYHVLQIIDITPEHTYLVLTKRPQRILEMMARGWLAAPLPDNVWLGVTAENQKRADDRIPILLSIPAAGHFVSLEPMLGAMDLKPYLPIPLPSCPLKNPKRCICVPNPALSWVIVGGESGPGARPTHPDWVRSVRDQCQEAGIAFHFKQWGKWVPADHWAATCAEKTATIGTEYEWPDGTVSIPVGKKRAGRLLDGREWNEYPEANQ